MEVSTIGVNVKTCYVAALVKAAIYMLYQVPNDVSVKGEYSLSIYNYYNHMTIVQKLVLV